MASTSLARPAQTDCIKIGDGAPLVVLPGLSRQPVNRPLAYLGLAHITHRRIHVMNRPAGLPRGLTMTEMASLHARMLVERFSEPVDVLGVSTGGAIALQLAVDHPKLVKRLIIAAAASWLGEEGRAKLRRYGDEVARGKSGAVVLSSVLAPRGLRWITATMLWAANRFEKRSSPDDMLATIDAEVGFDVTDQLHQIQSPTLVIGGDRDRAFPLPLIEATAAGIPNSRLIVYPKAGHLSTMINRRFGRDVAAFLSESIAGD